MASTNQRQAPRTPVTLKIKFKSETLDQFIERYSVDISQGGIFIRTKDPLPVGTTLRFEFQLKDASPLITGEGTVVWTRDQETSSPGVAPGMGVRFDNLPGQSQHVLERILAQKAPRRAPSVTPAVAGAGGEFGESPTRVAPGDMLQGLASNRHGDPGGGFGDSPTRVAPGELLSDLASEPAGESSSPDLPLAPRRLEDLPLRPPSGKAGASRPVDDRTPLPEPRPFSPDADEFGEEAFEESTRVANYGDVDLDKLRSGAASEQAADAADDPDALDDQPTGGAGDEEFDDEPTGDVSREDLEAAAVRDMESATQSAAGAAEARGDRQEAGEPEPDAGDADPSPEGDEPFATHEGWAEEPSPDGWKTDGDAVEGKLDFPLGSAQVAGEDDDQAPAEPRAATSSEPPPVGSDEAMERARELAMRDTPRRRRSKALLVALVAAGLGGAGFLAYQQMGEEESAGGDGGEGPELAEAASPAEPAQEQEPVEPAAAALVVETVPEGATVELVGEDRRETAPARFGDLAPDTEYTLRVTHPGYRADEVVARPGDEPRVELEPLPRVLSIRSEPPGASVIVDGEAQGSTPTEIALDGELSADERVRITLRRDGYRQATQTVGPNASFEDDGDKLVHELRVALSRVPQRPPQSRERGSDDDDDGAARRNSGGGSSGGGSSGGGSSDGDEASDGADEAPARDTEDSSEEAESAGAPKVEDLTRRRTSGSSEGDEAGE